MLLPYYSPCSLESAASATRSSGRKYLGTLLGSHSEATAAVLGLYLAGLSIGYSVFRVVSKRIIERLLQSGDPLEW